METVTNQLLTEMNNLRNEKIESHYLAAKMELSDLVNKNPYQTVFYITAGCLSEPITKELAHRFTSEGVDTKPMIGGIFVSSYYLEVTIDLPQELVHQQEQEEEREEEEEEAVVAAL
jgi:hypothetical protein